ncbi:MAG: hypothetical protein AAGF53_15650, partial [Pseudomonadota bacterium]
MSRLLDAFRKLGSAATDSICGAFHLGVFAVLVQSGASFAQESITFEYDKPAETETLLWFVRQEIQGAIAETREQIALGPNTRSFRLRFVASRETKDGRQVYKTIHQSQKKRVGSEPFEDTQFTWLPPRGTYFVEPTGSVSAVSEVGETLSLTTKEQEQVFSYFTQDSFSERFGRFIDGRSFSVGRDVETGRLFDEMLTEETKSAQFMLADLGFRWGRKIARFEANIVYINQPDVREFLTIDVDANTARTVRVSSRRVTETPTSFTGNDGQKYWRHIIINREIQYAAEGDKLERLAFELVNPTMLSQDGGAIQDIAFLPVSQDLVLLRETEADDFGRKRHLLGLWDLETQAVTQVVKSNSGGRLFPSDNAAHVMLADDGLSLSSYIISADGLQPFSAFFRFPNDETFSAWETLGINGVAGTTRGRVAFVNTGWDEEMGIAQISEAAIVGIAVDQHDQKMATLDTAGVLRLHHLRFKGICNEEEPTAAFCKDMRVEVDGGGHEVALVSPECATEIGRSVALVPRSSAVAYAATDHDGNCKEDPGVWVFDLVKNSKIAVPGSSFTLPQAGDRIVTEKGVFSFEDLSQPLILFTPEISDAQKVVLSEAESVAFVLTGSGSVKLVDLDTGTVLEDLTAQGGLTTPAKTRARAIWQDRFVALMSDGTAVIEHPQSGQTEFIDFARIANLPTGAQIEEAQFAAVSGRLLAVFKTRANGAYDLSVVAYDVGREPSFIGTFRVHPDTLANHVATSDQHLVIQRRVSKYGAPTDMVVIDGASAVTAPFPDVVATPLSPVQGLLLGRGEMRGHALVLSKRFDATIQALRSALLIVPFTSDDPDRNVSFVDVPDQLDTLQFGGHPMATNIEGNLVAISNLKAPSNGQWNPNGRIITVVDLKTGQRYAEMFQDWSHVTSLAFGPESTMLGVGYETGEVLLYDLGRGLVVDRLPAHDGAVTELKWAGNEIQTRGEDGVTRLWDLNRIDLDTVFREQADRLFGTIAGTPNVEVMTASVFDPIWTPTTRGYEGSVAVTSEGYYAGDKNRLRHVRFADRFKGVVDLTETDLLRNRPDVVFSRMGLISQDRRSLLASLHKKRVREAGPRTSSLTQSSVRQSQLKVRRTTPAITQNPQAKFELSLSPDQQLESLQVSNNGVGILSIPATTGRVELDIPLQPELNRVQINGIGLDGSSFVQHRSTVRYSAPSETEPPKTYVFAVGVSDYADDSLDLVYAAKDAKDVAAYFSGLTG